MLFMHLPTAQRGVVQPTFLSFFSCQEPRSWSSVIIVQLAFGRLVLLQSTSAAKIAHSHRKGEPVTHDGYRRGCEP